MRSSGVLMHITSIYTKFGIGDLGESAYEFVDFLKSSGQSIWQILPINPTGYGDSPYQCFSTFAGNPLLICPEKLFNEEINVDYNFPDNIVDYAAVMEIKERLFRRAYADFVPCKKFLSFKKANAHWLFDFANFSALKSHFSGEMWSNWADEPVDCSEEVEYHMFLQYIFFKQFTELKTYANKQGIKIMGDVPIFVAYDSADCWANPNLFKLDESGKPTAVAGVPPDYFSEDGQLWGNPLYDWKAHKADDYAWWTSRLAMAMKCFDIIRLDHFRGFESYWAVQADAETAKEGKWMPGPGKPFFDAMKRNLGQIPLVAEDLGIITPKVEALLSKLGLPGMRVLQFAFDQNPANTHLPHNFTNNLIAYTGTHDNDTTPGWYNNADEEEKDQFRRYFNVSGDSPAWDLIRAAMLSTANTAIIPVQDLLELDSPHRTNTPGTTYGNWKFRLSENQIQPHIAEALKSLSIMSNRNNL
ncbi:MAG: 4-alpha-glucanotransferase [Defluviitaleaceae bacterium]|nr:4-alpha-glucanotransferase [Defluviitaleaceae bacterium]